MKEKISIDGLDEYEISKIMADQELISNKSTDQEKSSVNSGIYRFILNLLAHIDMNESEAKDHYFKILEHRENLSSKMKRDVGIRVAILDYFLNLIKILKNPKIVEIEFFEEILKLTKEDPKTGCFNSNFMAEMAEREIKRAKRYNYHFSIILIDIDDFKALNDNYGHLFGDKVLKKFSAVLNASVRKEDIIGRFGGDEFVILLPQTGRVGARFLAERIKQNLENYNWNDNNIRNNIKVTFSAGIATYPMDSASYEGLMKLADSSLYKSKYLGKNRIHDKLEEELIKEQQKNKQKHAMPERRKFFRFPVKKDTEIELKKIKESMYVNGKVLDISQRGLLLECSCNIKDIVIKDNLDLEIKKIGDMPVEQLNIKASIAHFKKENENLKFYIGLEFNHTMETRQWKSLMQFVDLS